MLVITILVKEVFFTYINIQVVKPTFSVCRQRKYSLQSQGKPRLLLTL